jgi:contact-dependent growth inhibition (CDI) system CdiI-like immunity protein
VFWIGFSDEPISKVDPEEKGRVGLLLLGDHKERFVVHMDIWSKGDYVFQWKRALKRVLSGDQSALITDMHTPTTSNHLVWWPMWKFGDAVVFHNQLLFFKKHEILWCRSPERRKGHSVGPSPVDVDTLYKFVGQRESQSPDGRPLSEWRVPVREIRDFLNTMSASPDSHR